jgi:hypothetical protein
MARKTIDIGIVGNDGTGDSIRDSFRKVNDNFRELYGALGLGSRLRFATLEDAPVGGEGDSYYQGFENAVVSVNANESGLVFKQLVAGTGISLVFENENEITITNTRSTISADVNPRLGGNLKGQSGGTQYRIQELATPISSDEASNKAYTDTKIALAGVNAVDPAVGITNSAFGTMTGPLVLSRDPRPEDDVTYSGLVAATKNYVDNAGYASRVNLYVSTSGSDERIGVGSSTQGRALAFAYRTLEAALKRAEEIIKSSPPEIGPYKKVLTWTNPESGVRSNATLTEIQVSPDSGTGFAGRVTLTVDSVQLINGGFNFQAGEVLKIKPDGESDTNAATIEILTVNSQPGSPNGPILTYRIITGGKFDEGLGGTGYGLPDTNVDGYVYWSGITPGSTYGTNVLFLVKYRVSTAIIETAGSGYGLVSVRVSPTINDTGATAGFGFADVVSGEIAGVTITDGGNGFTEFPELVVNLPRFAIYTGHQRTDYTGDVTTDSAIARRGRDIREGLYLYGETSGALAQILAHSGELDTSGNELFDIDIKYGVFEPGESISYGDVANTRQLVVWVEAGIYYENLPLKVSQNVSIRGDEFRRSIIRPKKGMSSSPWAFQYFRRDKYIDGLNTARNDYNAARDDLFGYHYLGNADEPIYPEALINNKGYYRSAADLLSLNKKFIQEEVIAWINKQIAEEKTPYVDFVYNQSLCKRDVGLLIDAMVFDLRYGSAPRTISAALKYRGSATDLGDPAIAIGEQLDQTIGAIRRLEMVAQAVIKNTAVSQSSYTNPITGTVITYSEPQVIDSAYTAETGAGGTAVNILSITRDSNCTVTTAIPHGLATGETVTFRNMGGMTNLNGRSFTIAVATPSSFVIYEYGVITPVNSVNFTAYVANSGDVIPNGGVIARLTDVIVDIIDTSSSSFNEPLDNDKMDIFLMNDATILRALTMQGHGGFAMILDPEGQILAKSPYAQEGAVFSKSNGQHQFNGGMFVDGFAGNIQFRITEKVSNTRLKVSELKRIPQLPASFIVEDNVYRINYIRDFTYGTSGSTATLILDETTPWPYPVFTYNEAVCSRDVGLIIDGVGYDIVEGGNYWSRKAALTYRQANAAVVIDDQLDLTIRAVEYAHDLANASLAALTPTVYYDSSKAVVAQSKINYSNIIRRGTTAAPTLSMPSPAGAPSNRTNAKALLINNSDFLKQLGTGYITTTYPLLAFSSPQSQRDIEYIISAICYDLNYGGDSETRDAAYRYFNGVGDALELQVLSTQYQACENALTTVKDAAKEVIVNTTVSTTYGAASTQVKDLVNPSDSTVVAVLETLFSIVINALAAYRTTGGSEAAKLAAGVAAANIAASTYPNLVSDSAGRTYDTYRKTARTTLQAAKTTIQTNTIAWITDNSNVFEILMPGNRSMLSNDFTQICDMGYGLIAANGGLTEAVSMFTYYCYTSYYSLTGGQIRSVGGSSAHGVYALAAEGSDPLEVPTAVDLYYELTQGAVIYNVGGLYNNAEAGLIVYVTDYDYNPRSFSEVEVDHGGTTGLVRYPVISAVSESDFPSDSTGQKLYRLNLSSDTDGLVDEIPNGTRVTLRMNTEIILTGGVVGVAVRPSTALKLYELYTSQLYRVLQFTDYFPPTYENRTCTFSVSNQTIVTTTPHNQLPGYAVRFYTSGALPDGFIQDDTYWVVDEGYTTTTFKVALTKTGSPISIADAGSGSHYFVATKLANTLLKDGYNWAEMTLQPRQDYAVRTSSPGGPRIVVGSRETTSTYVYKILSVGTTAWNSIGYVGSPTVGGTFTRNSTSLADYGTGTCVVNSAICTFDHTTNTITRNSHGFSDGDVVRFDTNGTMPSGDPGLSAFIQYIVYNKGTNTFQLVGYPGSTTVIDFSDNGTGTFAVDLVNGAAGSTKLAIVEVGTNDTPRIVGMKFGWKGRVYEVTQYDSPAITGESYANVYFTPALEDSAVAVYGSVTLFAGVAARTDGSQGTLTIRIALTRVTSHDLLDIGTGSYADTNYPNEIYGPPIRIATETLLDTTGEVEYAQIVERGEGRCFFVTTDQFGNFSVGPFFRVDQGTGTVTFSASLALSNLSGLGFKRGVPIAEFSTDSSMSDNATDTVPTENATRTYIDRRLGVDHSGVTVDSGRLLPVTTGGFLALTGQLAMKGSLNLDQNRIRNIADPVDPQDAVNYRSISFNAIIANSFIGQYVGAGMTIAFTGTGNEGRAVTVGGDLSVPGDNAITTGIDSTQNEWNVYIKDNIIDNANINSAAAIAQSKLSMVTATTRANAVGITQADRGLASFNSAEFTLTNGWTELKTNGIELGKFAQIATDTVLGRSAAGTGDVSAVAFSTVVDEGFGVKKSQYSSTGFLRRTGVSTFSSDSDYSIVEAVALYSGQTDVTANSKIVIRDGSGDIGSRDIYATRTFYIGTSASANKKLADTSVTATGGSINVYGFSGVLGLSISDGSLTTDKVSSYRNNSHRFRLNDDSAFAPIQVSQVTSDTFTTGGASTVGTLTGNLSMSTTSNLTLGTGTIDASTGTLKSITLTTGAVGTAGTLTGAWSLNTTSKLIGQVGSEIDFSTGTIKSRTFTTGANTTTGNFTGNWTISSGSKIDFTSGTLQSTTLTTGATATAGVITGQWSVAVGSSINTGGTTLTTRAITTGAAATTGTIEGDWSMLTTSNITWGTGYLDMRPGTFYTDTLTTGAAGTAGDITGNWSMTSTSNLTLGTGAIDARTGTLYSRSLHSGATGTTGSITGAWTLASGSTLVASTIASQANSATITSTNANTGSTIVLRDASGDFSAGTITAALSGNATTASAWATGRTITLTGDVTGVSAAWTGSGNISIATTISADATQLGVDTTGQYASTVAVSGSGLSCTAPSAADGTAYTITSNATNANTGSTIVFRDVSGNFSAGTITATLSGNASTASTAAAWTTGRTITLTGDVTGVSGSWDGSSNISFATTIAANSVALGTDTTGDYIATGAVSGNGLSGSATGEGSSFTVTSNATSANTGSTIVFRDSSGNFSAGVMTGTATAARYADLAERYATDKEYPVGTVVVFGGEKEITVSNIKMDTRVAGVISANPAYMMNCEAGSDVTHPYVALAGRVPCRVAGKIKKGDMLVSSGIAGVAIATDNPRMGSMIGKALEDYDSDHIGTIEIVVGRA